jgi:hypothetical protein
MTALSQKRDKKLGQLLELASRMLLGSASETYRTCGNAGCRCHSTGPKHGPHMYVNYKDENGRTTGYYVPVALHKRVRDGLDAWREFHELAKDIAHMNKAIIDVEREKTKKKRKKRKT